MSDAATELDRPVSPTARRRGWPWRPLLVLAAGQLLAGALVGIAWRVWAPTTVSYLLSGAGGKTFVVPAESESQIAGDGRLVVLSVLLGVAFGVLGWRVRAARGPLSLAALAVGGVLSSVLARGIGELLPSGSPARRVNSAFIPHLSLHAFPALWVQAFFGVLVYTALTGLSADPELGGVAGQPAGLTNPNAGLTNPNAGLTNPNAGLADQPG